jgi:hypothetical protein
MHAWLHHHHLLLLLLLLLVLHHHHLLGGLLLVHALLGLLALPSNSAIDRCLERKHVDIGLSHRRLHHDDDPLIQLAIVHRRWLGQDLVGRLDSPCGPAQILGHGQSLC